MERRGDGSGQPLNPVSGYCEAAFAPDAPTARYIAGANVIAARPDAEPDGVVSQLIASSLYATIPPCPTATNRVANLMARKPWVSGGGVVFQVVKSVLVRIVPESPTAT
jgi:hypothetical protein